jgi:ferredoxin
MDALPKIVSVRLDRDLCVGNGMCRLAAPRAFIEDEPTGLSLVSDPSAESPAALEEAAESCPVAAIELSWQ